MRDFTYSVETYIFYLVLRSKRYIYFRTKSYCMLLILFDEASKYRRYGNSLRIVISFTLFFEILSFCTFLILQGSNYNLRIPL